MTAPTAPGDAYSSREAFVSNQYFRAMNIHRAGGKVEGHAHTFDHVTVLCRGAVKCTVNGKVNLYSAEATQYPVLIYIRKNLHHEFEALVDNTVLICCHADRLGRDSGDILDAEMVPDGVLTPELQKNLVPLTAMATR